MPSPTAFASEVPNVPLDALGAMVLVIIVLGSGLVTIRKLLGWDKPNVTQTELNAITNKVDQCATRTELAELSRKLEKLEENTRERIHGTFNSVNQLRLDLEKMRLQLMQEINGYAQRVEDKISRHATVLGRLETLVETLERKEQD